MFELHRTRRELQAALDALRDEVEGQAHSERARAISAIHAWTAVLLLRGTAYAHIVGVLP